MNSHTSSSKEFASGISGSRSVPHLAAVFVIVLATAQLALPAVAADTPDPQPAAASRNPLGAAREHIAAKRWQAAIDELKRVNARRDADWNNLMGYALRKQPTPDLAGAERHYDEALRINPKHLGALEYSGELYLMKGDLAKAEARLQTLAGACNNCEELEDLKKATARFKADGNRYVPSY